MSEVLFVCVSEATNQLSASCLPLLFFSGQIWRMIHLQVLLPVLGICIFHEHHPERAPPATRVHAPVLRVCTRLFESGAGTGRWMEIMKAFLRGSGEEDKFGNAR